MIEQTAAKKIAVHLREPNCCGIFSQVPLPASGRLEAGKHKKEWLVKLRLARKIVCQVWKSFPEHRLGTIRRAVARMRKPESLRLTSRAARINACVGGELFSQINKVA